MVKDLSWLFTNEDPQMTNQYMKACSISLVIREVQISTSMRYKHTPTRMAKIKQTDNTKF